MRFGSTIVARLARWIVLWLGVVAACGAAPLWVATPNEVLHYAVSAEPPSARAAFAGSVQLGATTEGGAWALSRTSLVYVAADGAAQVAVAVDALGHGDATLLAVDAFDHSAWVATARNLLVHVARDGRVLGGYTLPGRASGIAAALDRSVWVAGEDRVWHFSATLQLLATLPVASSDGSAIAAVAVDSLADRLWVASEHAVAVIALRERSAAPQAMPVASGVRSIALDPKVGVLWVLRTGALSAYDASGERVAEIALADVGAEDAVAIAFDTIEDTLVLTLPTAIRSVDRAGSVVASIDRETERVIASVLPFLPLPRLSVLRPPDYANTRETRPAFQLRLDTVCGGLVCDVAPDYLRTMRWLGTLNGQSVNDLFRFDPEARIATLIPATPLVPGWNAFTAVAVDRFERRSDAIDVRLNMLDAEHPSITIKAGNQAPSVALTAPANNARFTPGASISLSATATDADGTIAKVEFYRGGSTLIGTATTVPYTVVWGNAPAGSYSLTAKATDNKGGTKTSTAVSITVAPPPNIAPSITITAPVDRANVNGPNVIVTARAVDSDGMVSKVDFYDGATLLGTVAGGVASVDAVWTIRNAAAGAHTLKAIATDNAGATASAQVAISVNAAPYVVLASPANCSEVVAPATIVLRADALDTDGTVARVDFYQGTTLLGSATRSPYTATWSGAAQGTYALTAVATDNLGATRASNPVTVTVAPPNTPPTVAIVTPVDGVLVGAGAEVTVTARATDGDGRIAKVEYFADGVSVGVATNAPYAVKWTASAVAVVALVAKATDNQGGEGTSEPVHVTVIANALPTVTLTAPGAGTKLSPPAPIALTASASDPDGSIAKVEFYWGYAGTTPSNRIGAATTAPYKVDWGMSAPGAYVLMAKAIDNLGGTAVSQIVGVEVVRPPAVSITAPADNANVPSGTSLTVTVHATDYDGALTQIDLIRNGAVIATATPPTGSTDHTLNVTMKVAGGTYVFTGRATDNRGVVGTSTPITVLVNDVPAVTLIEPVNDASFAAPATIGLAARVRQAVGAIAKVEFFSGSQLIGTSTTPPYAYTWTAVPTGTYTITARATDNLGSVGTSAATTISVGQVALNIVTPVLYAAVRESSIVVSGNYAGGAATSVTVNGIPATLGNGTFAATVPLAVDQNQIIVTANIGGTVVSRSTYVSYTPPAIAFRNASDGYVVHDDNFALNGVITAPGNSMLFVNGRPATIDQYGSYFLNRIPLVPGDNPLEAVLVMQDGSSIRKTVLVKSDAVGAFTFDVSPDSSLAAPQTVAMTLRNRGLVPFRKVDVVFDSVQKYSDTIENYPEVVPEWGIQVNYPTPGLHQVRIQVWGEGNTTLYTASRMLLIGDPADLDAKLRGVYAGMLDHLRAGNIERAAMAVTRPVRDQYIDVFRRIGSGLAWAVDGLGTVGESTLAEGYASVIITREETDGTHFYQLLMLQDEDGIWRIESM